MDTMNPMLGRACLPSRPARASTRLRSEFTMTRATLTAALVGITALTACTADSQPGANAATPSLFSPTATGTDPVILVLDDQEGGSQMMPLTACLRWIENESCLVVVAGNYRPERTAIPVWPKGTVPLRGSDGRRGVTSPEGEQILAGDALSGGGSWIRPDSPVYPKFTPPAGCRGHDLYFVIDSTDLRRL
ncbi:hypothetical protein [Nonomuraea sp. KM90]|uniref:hypothetical protein n=1 Tax=Nonomuraea sp. KM90 TaxID=3457428 RepID=UPI003FCEAF14